MKKSKRNPYTMIRKFMFFYLPEAFVEKYSEYIFVLMICLIVFIFVLIITIFQLINNPLSAGATLIQEQCTPGDKQCTGRVIQNLTMQKMSDRSL